MFDVLQFSNTVTFATCCFALAPTRSAALYALNCSASLRVIIGEPRELMDLHREYMLALCERVLAPLEAAVSGAEQHRKTLAAAVASMTRERKAALDNERRARQRYADAAERYTGEAGDEKRRAARAEYVAAVERAQANHAQHFEKLVVIVFIIVFCFNLT